MVMKSEGKRELKKQVLYPGCCMLLCVRYVIAACYMHVCYVAKQRLIR